MNSLLKCINDKWLRFALPMARQRCRSHVRGPLSLSVYWFFLNTVRCCGYNGTLWLLHWPVKTSHWTRSHYPDKAIEETLNTVMRSFSDLCPSVCDLFFFVVVVALHLHDHFAPEMIPMPPSPSTWRPCLLQMDFSCFIEIPNVEVRGTLIKMSWEDESGERGVK